MLRLHGLFEITCHLHSKSVCLIVVIAVIDIYLNYILTYRLLCSICSCIILRHCFGTKTQEITDADLAMIDWSCCNHAYS